jgi:glycosyltransferase involved in cell wall biosynthesis
MVNPDADAAEQRRTAPGTSEEARRATRILFVTSNLPRWQGDSTTPFVLHLACDLRTLGWDVHVLAPHAPGARVEDEIEGVPIERFRYLRPESAQTVCYQGGALVNLRRSRWNLAKLPLLVLCEWAAVRRRLKNGSFHLVHSHWVLPQGFTAALAARPYGVPHVATAHGSDIFALNGPLLTACKRFALARADAVTVNSSATGQAVTRIASQLDWIERIPMGASDARGSAAGIRALRAAHIRGAGPLLLFVGRLLEQKGVADLLAAVALLRTQLPDIAAMIVGDGPQSAKLHRLAAQLGIADRVTFMGWVDPGTIADYYGAADIFVAPSKRGADGSVEAQGLTVIEAMLAGTPVVATGSGGIADAVHDRETGLLVREGAPAEIAHCVAEIFGDPLLARHLRDNALALAARQFTRQGSAAAFSSLYERVLARQRVVSGNRLSSYGGR